MQKLPIIGDRFVKTIPASDNVCGHFLSVGIGIWAVLHVRWANSQMSGKGSIWKGGKGTTLFDRARPIEIRTADPLSRRAQSSEAAAVGSWFSAWAGAQVRTRPTSVSPFSHAQSTERHLTQANILIAILKDSLKRFSRSRGKAWIGGSLKSTVLYKRPPNNRILQKKTIILWPAHGFQS